MLKMINLLLVDDEAMLREAVSSFFEKKGFQVYTAETGTEALRILEARRMDFIILDLMLPDLSGEEVCARIREKSKVPVIMLTAKTMEEDVLKGLELGADDYIKKPFSLRELYARAEAVMRRIPRREEACDAVLQWNAGDLEADRKNHVVKKQGRIVPLTPIEQKIFDALVAYPQKIFTREELLEIAFGDDFDGYDRVIDTHIKNLRRKLEADSRNPVYILTVHGVGYRFGGDRI